MRHRRPSRFRRIAKWVGFGLCLFMAGVWAFSLHWSLRHFVDRENGGFVFFAVDSGVIDCMSHQQETPKTVTRRRSCRRPLDFASPFRLDNGCKTRSGPIRWSSMWMPKVKTTRRSYSTIKYQNRIYRCPWWIPAFLIGSMTGFLAYTDRRKPPGHCRTCDYNLTGNESGKCPECSTPVPKQETTA